MKYLVFIMAIILAACNNDAPGNVGPKEDTSKTVADTVGTGKKMEADSLSSKTYANKRFRNVTIKRMGNDTFLVRGQGQIFEANFNWSVEDGHEELMKGYETTDAGAPEWGNFEFSIHVQKKRPHSTLTLILYESSAKDGSRQYELPITL